MHMLLLNFIFSIACFFSNCNFEKNIVIVITSYNNASWYEKNLESARNQKYSNFRVIYIDDASPDGTGSLVESYIFKYGLANKFTLIKNQKNLSQMFNHITAVQMCRDEEIVVHLDGDDYFGDEQGNINPFVLSKINEIYSSTDTWITFGRALQWPSKQFWPETEISQNELKKIIKRNRFRKERWVYGHLRSFYAWLFKKIKVADLQYKGSFEGMSPCPDVAFMYPMLEMAGNHVTYLHDAMYVWNKSNPLSQDKLNKLAIPMLHDEICSWRRYKPLKINPKK